MLRDIERRQHQAMLGREVELRTYEDLSRYFRNDIRARARVCYVA